MHNTARKLLATTLLMGACLGVGYAQNGNGLEGNNDAAATAVLRPPIGTVNNCDIFMNVALTSDFGDASFSASGTGSFQTTAVTRATEPAGNTQAPQELRATAETELGTITWNFARDARNTPTTITANQLNTSFPATSDIYFTPEATISSRPGITYRADREVRLHTSNLNSFAPQRDERYTVDDPINFVADDGSSGFTIELTGVVVSEADEPAVSVLRPPIDVIIPCGVGMTVIFNSATFGSTTFDATGTASFQTTAVTSEAEPAGNTQRPVSLTASAETEFGTISWNFSRNADNTATTITANQTGADFPATSDIYFTPEATISSRPGVVFRSTREVHLQNTELNSFNPQNNESYSVEGPIEFSNEDGSETFTIELADVIVTAADEPEPDVLRPDIGTISQCPATWRTILTLDGATYEFDAAANASFETVSVTDADENAGNTQRTASLEARAQIGELGTITWRFGGDAANTTATTITANQADANFPATSDIYFTPVATISSRPGAIYTATREVHLQSTSLSSFGPQVNERYDVVDGPIEFVDADGNSFTIELSDFIVGSANAQEEGNGLLSQRKEQK